jgi:hypothetical protein
MRTENPFDLINDRLAAIEDKVGDINMIVRYGNFPPIRRKKKAPKDSAINKEKELQTKGGRDGI